MILLIILELYRVTVKQRKELCVKLCGAENFKDSEVYGQYQRELEEYKENRRAWTVYLYQMARYQKGKSYEKSSYPRAWLYVHRIAVSVTAVVLAAVITVTCIFASRDTRFQADNLVKIGLGADETRVTQVLGEPNEKMDTTWYYYSGNYASLLKEKNKLEEASKNASSMEEFDKLLKQFNELQEKINALEYQTIVVTFSSSDEKVTQMKLDAAATAEDPAEKKVKEITISPTSITAGSTTKVSYAILYEDGSYSTAYFRQAQLPTAKGDQTIEWYDSWGSYSVEIHVS